MRATLPGVAQPLEFFGKANVINAIATHSAFQNCGTAQVFSSGMRVEFVIGGINIKLDLQYYGINVYLTVQGGLYLPTDRGICPKAIGWDTELNCLSEFTSYPNDNCQGLPRLKNPPIDVDACDVDLRAEAQKRCGACPDVVAPAECVAEVCALNDIAAAADLLESCDINETPIAP